MTNWTTEVDIYTIVRDWDDDPDPDVKACAEAVRTELLKLPPRLRHDISDIIEELEQVEDQDDLNFQLQQLYEWGDNTKVFTGPSVRTC